MYVFEVNPDAVSTCFYHIYASTGFGVRGVIRGCVRFLSKKLLLLVSLFFWQYCFRVVEKMFFINKLNKLTFSCLAAAAYKKQAVA